jgi:hypothetical protein
MLLTSHVSCLLVHDLIESARQTHLQPFLFWNGYTSEHAAVSQCIAHTTAIYSLKRALAQSKTDTTGRGARLVYFKQSLRISMIYVGHMCAPSQATKFYAHPPHTHIHFRPTSLVISVGCAASMYVVCIVVSCLGLSNPSP